MPLCNEADRGGNITSHESGLTSTYGNSLQETFLELFKGGKQMNEIRTSCAPPDPKWENLERHRLEQVPTQG